VQVPAAVSYIAAALREHSAGVLRGDAPCKRCWPMPNMMNDIDGARVPPYARVDVGAAAVDRSGSLSPPAEQSASGLEVSTGVCSFPSVGAVASGDSPLPGGHRLHDDAAEYPVRGRTSERNRRIAGHEIGHAFLARALGSTVHSCSIIPGDGFEGRVIRSGPKSQLDFTEYLRAGTDEIVDVCAQLEHMAPELGSGRVADSEAVVRAQCLIIELLGGEVTEQILHPNHSSLGAKHDQIEANAFAKVAVAASPAVAALIAYCEAEAAALIRANIEIVHALVEALIERGILTGDEIDTIIAREVAAKALANERARRVAWRIVEKNAADFAAYGSKG